MAVKTVDQIGTVATSSPARPDEILVSALVMRNHGPIISKSAYSEIHLIPLKALLRVPCFIEIGTRMAAPIITRAKTTEAGENSRTATRIKR